MRELIAFLNEVDNGDKLYVFFFIIVIIAILIITAKWLIKRGVKINLGIFKLDPSSIHSDDLEKTEKEIYTGKDIDGGKNMRRRKMRTDDLFNFYKLREKEKLEDLSDDLTEEELREYKESENIINNLKNEIKKLENDLKEKDKIIKELNKKIRELSIDKLQDFVSFYKIMDLLSREHDRTILEICNKFLSDPFYDNISSDDYEIVIKESHNKLLEYAVELFDTRYSGLIVKQISNIYSLMTSKEEEQEEKEWADLLLSIRALHNKAKIDRSSYLKNVGLKISDNLSNWKIVVFERLKEVLEPSDTRSDLEKLNYLIKDDELMRLVATVSSFYVKNKEIEKVSAIDEQMKIARKFKERMLKILVINFKKILLKTIENEGIENMESYFTDK